jgi:hypothetical protein
MLPEHPLPQSTEAGHLDRMESAIHELNVQIARLAILLGVSLESREQVAQALQPASEQAPHGAHKHEELRALLVMRYELEKSYIEELGPEQTQQLMLRSEQALVRAGFKRGADGVDLAALTQLR